MTTREYNKFSGYDKFIYRGDTESIKMTVKDAETDTALDLSTYAIKVTAKETPNASTNLFSIDLADSVNGNSWATGVVRVVIPATTTRDLPAKSFYDIQATLGTVVYTLLTGRLLARDDISA
jgi:hypothetical protein